MWRLARAAAALAWWAGRQRSFCHRFPSRSSAALVCPCVAAGSARLAAAALLASAPAHNVLSTPREGSVLSLRSQGPWTNPFRSSPAPWGQDVVGEISGHSLLEPSLAPSPLYRGPPPPPRATPRGCDHLPAHPLVPGCCSWWVPLWCPGGWLSSSAPSSGSVLPRSPAARAKLWRLALGQPKGHSCLPPGLKDVTEVLLPACPWALLQPGPHRLSAPSPESAAA